MAVITVHTSSINHKYIGYAGDVTNVATGQDIYDTLTTMLNEYTSVESVISGASNAVLAWRTDGTVPSNVTDSSMGDAFFATEIYTPSAETVLRLNAEDTSGTQYQIDSANLSGTALDITTFDKGVAYSNGIDLGIFVWNEDTSNNLTQSLFLWLGEVAGNNNISSPQTRCAIGMEMSGPDTVNKSESFGVYKSDSSTKRNHYDTEATADHAIDCGTNTANVYLIESDSGGDNTVGYCPNVYLSKDNLTIGTFVTINNLTDGGSDHGVVVAKWGGTAYLVMRQYNGVN